MKYFKNEAGQVFAYEADGSQDDIIGAELVACTEAEAMQLAALWCAERADRGEA